jgi:hypothetical protein
MFIAFRQLLVIGKQKPSTRLLATLHWRSRAANLVSLRTERNGGRQKARHYEISAN